MANSPAAAGHGRRCRRESVAVLLLLAGIAAAADRFWVGDDGAWSDAANWSETVGGGGGASAPGTGNRAVFDAFSGDCNVDVNIDVGGMVLTNFTGTVRVLDAHTVRIASSPYYQDSGTFIGGQGLLTIFRTPFLQVGGEFTHTNGPALFWTYTDYFPIDGNPQFGDLRFNTSGGGGTYTFTILATATVTVHGVVNFQSDAGSSRIDTGTLNVYGDVVSRNLARASTAWMVLRGTNDLVVSGTGGGLPNLRIDKPSGAVRFAGTPQIARHLQHLSGEFDAGTSMFTIWATTGYNATMTSAVGRLVFHDLRFDQGSGGGDDYPYYLAPDLTVVVTNRLLLDGGSGGLRLHNGTVDVHGDLVVNSRDYHNSTARFLVIGSRDQTIASNNGRLPALRIDKADGVLWLNGSLQFYHGSAPAPAVVFDHRAGRIDAGSSRVHFETYNRNTTVASAAGELVFNDVRISSRGGGGTYDFIIAPDTTLVSTGILSFARTAGSFRIRQGKLHARGHVHNIGGIVSPGSDTVLELIGDAVQEIDVTGYETLTRLNVRVDKNGGEVRLASNYVLNQPDMRLAVDRGAVNLHTNVLTFSGANTVYSNSPDAELRLTLASSDSLIRHTGSGSQALINGSLFVERAPGFMTPQEASYTVLESVTPVVIDPPQAPFAAAGRTGRHELLYNVLYNDGGYNVVLTRVRIPRGLVISLR